MQCLLSQSLLHLPNAAYTMHHIRVHTSAMWWAHTDAAACSVSCVGLPWLPSQVLESSTAFNVAGWDHFGRGFLTIYQCMTLTGWSYVMYRSMDSTSPFASIPFYTTFVLLSAFVVVGGVSGMSAAVGWIMVWG